MHQGTRLARQIDILPTVLGLIGVAAVRDERYKFLGRMLKKQRDLFYPAPIPIMSQFAEPMLTDVALDNESHGLSLHHPERSKRLEAAIVAFQASLRDNPRGWKP